MPCPLSNDLRKRIIEAKERGDTEAQIAKEKGVSTSTITKLWSLYRKTGSYKPRPNPNGRKSVLSQEQLVQITNTISASRDITLQELIDKLNLSISVSALCRIINNKLKLRHKKNSASYRTKPRRRKSQTRSMDRISI